MKLFTNKHDKEFRLNCEYGSNFRWVEWCKNEVKRIGGWVKYAQSGDQCWLEIKEIVG